MPIHAYAAHEKRGRLEPFDYEPAPVGPHDVEIAVSHCGICHSDVHLVDGDWGVGSYPMVPGHEIVGSVVATGPAVAHLKAKDRVGVGWQTAYPPTPPDSPAGMRAACAVFQRVFWLRGGSGAGLP